jgi:hypothetical protein
MGGGAVAPPYARPLCTNIQAAQVVLDGLFAPPPSDPFNPFGPMRAFAHAQQYALQTAALALSDREAYELGRQLGTVVGERVLAERADDGHPPAIPPVTNGSQWWEYQYDLPYFQGLPGSAAGYSQVRPFGVTAFGLDGGEVTFVDPPLPVGSPSFQAQWEETFGYGTADPERSLRTETTDATAAFHDGNFGSQIGGTIDVLSSAEGLPDGGTELLRVVALTAMSCHDAHANHWFWKFRYLVGRPITQYRQVPLGQPDGLGAQRDGFWGEAGAMELTTNQNPEHPSGHSSRTNALTASLRMAAAGGDATTFRTISFSQPQAPAREYPSFTALEEEVRPSP